MARNNQLSFEERARNLETLVRGLLPAQASKKALAEIIAYAREVPEKFFTSTFPSDIARVFNEPPETVALALWGGSGASNIDFDLIVPKKGWLHDYIEYTKNTEPPTAFHFFAAVTTIGATIARRRFLAKGSGNIYPNLSCVLVSPPGVCKKTTACNLSVNLYRRIGGTIFADKVTPEALVEALQAQTAATGLIYAPEWSVFLGKQQYMEGLVPMLTALFDCPDTWSSGTLMRGNTQLTNVAISHLACSTIDWMQSSITKDAFAGGFMSRLLFIVQKTTPRSFPIPPPLDVDLGKALAGYLVALTNSVGEVTMSPEALKWYVNWYHGRSSIITDKHFAGYFERKPDRMLQLAMVLNACEDIKSFTLSKENLEDADRFLQWIERYLPGAFAELSQSMTGDDQHKLLRQIRARRGEVDYSEWLRLNISRIGVDGFKKHIDTLIHAKMIALDPTKHRYYLLAAGKEVE